MEAAKLPIYVPLFLVRGICIICVNLCPDASGWQKIISNDEVIRWKPKSNCPDVKHFENTVIINNLASCY
jgi:hypothetical protein